MTTSFPEEPGSHIDPTRQRRKAPAVPPAEPRRNPSDPALAMDADRYKWLLQVGEGGMGQVWKGLDTVLNRTVALKRIRPELARIPDLLQRFRTEATSLAQLNHPNVVRIYDFANDDQGPFLVMQWVDGRNLDDVLSAEGPLAPARAALLIAKTPPRTCACSRAIEHAVMTHEIAPRDYARMQLIIGRHIPPPTE